MQKLTIIISLLFFLTASLCAQSEKGDILIKNGTVLTVADEEALEDTDVLIQDGKITQIGKDINAPSGTEVIDASGKFVMPGIIDAHSHIAIDAVNEATNPNTAEVWVGDAIDPFDVSIYRALAGGVTASHSMHGSANAIGGQCETIKHRYGTYNPNDLRMVDAPRTIKFALGENPMRVHGEGHNKMMRTRMGIEQAFRKAFSDGEKYMKKQEAYEKGKESNAQLVPPKYDRRLETIADILRGDILIHCHSYRADEILMLMEVLKEFGVDKITFQHVNEGFKVAPELADFGASASVFSDWWAYKFEVYYSTAYNAAILTRNGVVTSINSDSGELIRHLFHEAAKTQHYGDLNDQEALALITLNPAIQLGIDDRVGTLEVGKEGDVAIFEGHPLSVYAIPQMTIIDGVKYFDINDDPDDMRLDVNPEDAPSSFMLLDKEDHDRCMDGVREQLFGY